jgi:hypothetical protein
VITMRRRLRSWILLESKYFVLLGIIISYLIALYIIYRSTNSVTKLVLAGYSV